MVWQSLDQLKLVEAFSSWRNRMAKPRSSASRTFTFSATLVHETESAVLLDHGGDKPAWLPKALVQDEGDDEWSAPEWVGLDRGII